MARRRRPDGAATQAAMARTEVNARRPRQRSLAGVDGRPPDEGFQLLTEVFHREEEK
jgi:L-rhamnose mutarotase